MSVLSKGISLLSRPCGIKSKSYLTKWIIFVLTMLGLYLITLIFSPTSCKMLSSLNKLILQNKLQNSVTKNVFWTKSRNTTTTKERITHKTIARSGLWTQDPSHRKPMRYLCTQESTKMSDCSQYIYLFWRNAKESKRK